MKAFQEKTGIDPHLHPHEAAENGATEFARKYIEEHHLEAQRQELRDKSQTLIAERSRDEAKKIRASVGNEKTAILAAGAVGNEFQDGSFQLDIGSKEDHRVLHRPPPQGRAASADPLENFLKATGLGEFVEAIKAMFQGSGAQMAHGDHERILSPSLAQAASPPSRETGRTT